MTIYSAAWIRRMSTEAPQVITRLGREVCQYLTPSIQTEIDQWNSVPRDAKAAPPISVRELSEEERERWAPLIEPFFENPERRQFAENGEIQYGLRNAGYVVRLSNRISSSSINSEGPLGNVVRNPTDLVNNKTTEGTIVGQFWLEPGCAVAVASQEVLCVPPFVVEEARLLPQYALLGLCFNAFANPGGMRSPLGGILSNPTTVPVVVHEGQGFAEVRFSLAVHE